MHWFLNDIKRLLLVVKKKKKCFYIVLVIKFDNVIGISPEKNSNWSFKQKYSAQ